jgi:predicted metal-binding protein
MAHRITVCSSCEGLNGKGFAAELRVALAGADLTYEVRDFDCMSNCARPLSVAFSAADKATYLFGDVDTAGDLKDVIAFASLYAKSPDGWIEDARPAGRLRQCLIGRVPA